MGAIEREELQGDRAFRVLFDKPRVSGCTESFRSKYLDLVLPLDDCTLHDEWVTLVLGMVTRIRCLEEPLVLYRQHDAQVMGAIRARRSRGTSSRAGDISCEIGPGC